MLFANWTAPKLSPTEDSIGSTAAKTTRGQEQPLVGGAHFSL
jgi:hypothetical protein